LRAELDRVWRSVSRSGKFIGGEFVERFEQEWAAYCERHFCVGLSDGTAAVELALRALGVGPGDEVIVPANTFIATWEAIVAVGARPVGTDVDPDTLLITAEAIAEACTPRTAAIIVVHLFGQMANMDAINHVAGRSGIPVIEDAAQAHGATWKGHRAGSLSDVGCFSFYPGKNLGAFGDAGAIVTDRAELAQRVRSMANHGRSATAADVHICVGDNRRLDGLQAAILSAKLAHLDRWNGDRRKAFQRYQCALNDLPIRVVGVGPDAISSHHLMVVEVPNRDEVQRALGLAGIGTGVHYRTPCHRHRPYAHFSTKRLPVVEQAAGRILSLPMSPGLTHAQIARVASELGATLFPSKAPRLRTRYVRVSGRAILGPSLSAT
jgi:dTDP-4-amino-4,6-dideoxygalactose transaminase